jgi:hypothetical protein
VRLEPSEAGQVVEGIFYFRLTTTTRYRASDTLDADVATQVLLRHRSDNQHGADTIEVLTNPPWMSQVSFQPL